MTETLLAKLKISLKDEIAEFSIQVDQRQSTKLFAQAKEMLQRYEAQRATLFNENGAYYTNGIKPASELSLLVKLVAKQNTIVKWIRRYDSTNDQVDLARALIVELTILLLLMNGDGIDSNPLFKQGAFYIYTRIERPVQPLLEVFKNYMISFVRPLHSPDAPPEWEPLHFERDWEKIANEVRWESFKLEQ